MGLFDKVKGLAEQVKGEGVVEKYAAEMSTTISESLSKVLATAKEHIQEDAGYISYVATPLFKMLPLPAQLIGRERLKWDPIMLDIRTELALTSATPQLDKDASNKILAIVKKHHQA